MTSTMSSVDVVKRMYEAFGRGDIEKLLSYVAPDCKWVAPGEGIPSAGVYAGPAGVADFFRKLSESEEFVRFEVKEFFSSGDDVVTLGVEDCRSLVTGKSMSSNWAMLFRVSNGRVTYFEPFYDTAAYVRAHQG